MTRYQLSGENYVTKGDLRISTVDTLEYPNTNEHYLAYRDWLAAGNVPDPAPQTQVEVPQSVTRFQAQAALHLSGHLDTVNALMANEATPMLARLAWANALEFKRQSPTVLAMGAALGLSDEAIDQLFITAAQIEA
jgi:hypothetical protein